MKNTALYIFFLFFSLVAQAQEEFSVYFDSNKYELKKQENERLQNFINTNKEVKIVAINGYTDEDGTTAFNDTLAQKRVDFIYGIINGKLKIRDDFKTRSFGERHRQSKIKSENRKVTIYFLLAKDLPRENEILGIKEEPVVKKQREMPKYPQKMTLQNPNGTTSELVFDVAFMEKLTVAKPGEKIKLENLNFQLNTFAITNDSRPKMYELLEVMKRNPQMKIQIQGHICCMQNDKQDLSTKRAKAIARFLEMNGIDKDRVTYKGFGVTEPLFAIPEKSEEERAANRRVEIEIIEN
ncbi:MAG: OmpA family protein [Flavobacterium lindanitolerans]|jgi:outer membrane protein OmpA-like peptidoglycan-associated protein|uniref:OmpA family protein n=1 Tax=Flavobacterium TaxID=237 RepID=UPI0006F54FE3|nr:MULTISPECIES: OmpA family protein [Flavobacterium]KQS47560.1 cell envelope biogenesis protein OmpA [Flavobacterium sp. Leaf359]MBL7868946.1 OmpA family protein [Flavobacterium lindanitolerans]